MEQQLIARIPEISRDLIMNIPRLNDVAEIIYYQDKNYDGSGFPYDPLLAEAVVLKGENIPQISRLLKILNAMVKVSKKAMPVKAEFDFVERSTGAFDPELFKLVREILSAPNIGAGKSELLEIGLNLVRAGDVLQADLINSAGQLLLAVDYQLTDTQVHRLREMAKLGHIRGNVKVLREVQEKVIAS